MRPCRTPSFPILFDAAATKQRVSTLTKAIAAGKHIYSEKPVALSVADGMALLTAARARNLKHGAVEDKIFLPGLQKLSAARRAEILRPRHRLSPRFRLVGVRRIRAQKPAAKLELPAKRCRRSHHGYVSALALRRSKAFSARSVGLWHATATAIPQRADESGTRYDVDVDDTSLTLAELENGAVGTIACSWATRVRRDDLLTFQIDGTSGSAVAGLHRCWAQSAGDTPEVRHINPMVDIGFDYRRDWKEVPGLAAYANPYRVGWDRFLKHIVTGEPLASDLSAGIRDVQTGGGLLSQRRRG